MSQILSSEEVDTLLEEQSESAAPEQPAPYDIAAPVILFGERLAMVEQSCGLLGAPVSESVTSLLMSDKPVKAAYTGLLQQPAREILAAMTPAEPLGVIVGTAGDPIGAVQLQPDLLMAIVDRAQGGEGSAPDEPRPFTEVERALIGQSMTKIVVSLRKHGLLGEIGYGGVDLDPASGTMAERGGSLVAATYRLVTGRGDALFRLLMAPPLANRLVVDAEEERPEQIPAAYYESLLKVPVGVRPSITGASISIRDLRRLQPGMVIQFEPHEHDAITLNIGGLLAARGKLTRARGQRQFELEHFLGSEEPGGADS